MLNALMSIHKTDGLTRRGFLGGVSAASAVAFAMPLISAGACHGLEETNNPEGGEIKDLAAFVREYGILSEAIGQKLYAERAQAMQVLAAFGSSGTIGLYASLTELWPQLRKKWVSIRTAGLSGLLIFGNTDKVAPQVFSRLTSIEYLQDHYQLSKEFAEKFVADFRSSALNFQAFGCGISAPAIAFVTETRQPEPA